MVLTIHFMVALGAPFLFRWLLTVPVSAHMVGRAGYRTKRLRKDPLTADDLDQVVEAAARSEAGARAGRDAEGPDS